MDNRRAGIVLVKVLSMVIVVVCSTLEVEQFVLLLLFVGQECAEPGESK